MSWLTPTIRDVMSDNAAVQHKLMFFEQGATPNVVVSLNENVTPEAFEKFVEIFQEENEGVANAYKTLFFGGGASVDVVGANLQQISFKEVQGAVETRIAAAAGVPPIVVGLSEGLQYATYSNYSQARRAFADGTLSHLWQNASGSLETLVDKKLLKGGGKNARLWYDARHIAFLKADVKEDAEVQQVKATTVNSLITAGFKPDAALQAAEAGDFGLLEGQHTGLVSVQLMKPGEKKDPPPPPAAEDKPPPNGKTSAPLVLPPGKGSAT
jgi:phage portal protein BeeE